MFLSRDFRTTDFGIIKTKNLHRIFAGLLAGKGQTKLYLGKESLRLCLGSRDLPAHRSSEGATAELRLCWTPSLQMSGSRGNLLPCCASAIPGLQHRLAVKEGTNGFQTIPLLTIPWLTVDFWFFFKCLVLLIDKRTHQNVSYFRFTPHPHPHLFIVIKPHIQVTLMNHTYSESPACTEKRGSISSFCVRGLRFFTHNFRQEILPLRNSK